MVDVLVVVTCSYTGVVVVMTLEIWGWLRDCTFKGKTEGLLS
jgi:hypothetical protein